MDSKMRNRMRQNEQDAFNMGMGMATFSERQRMGGISLEQYRLFLGRKMRNQLKRLLLRRAYGG
jgi:hypothetical protein